LLVFVAHLLAPFTLATLAISGAGIASLGAAMFPPDVFFVIMGFCAGAFFPTIYVAATQKMGGSARVSPTIIAAGLVGGILMPLILSPLMTHLGERGFFWVFAALLGMMTVIAVLFRKRFNV
jgi:MFS transporter, FHS family, glucose/mannose:H+ symporter